MASPSIRASKSSPKRITTREETTDSIDNNMKNGTSPSSSSSLSYSSPAHYYSTKNSAAAAAAWAKKYQAQERREMLIGQRKHRSVQAFLGAIILIGCWSIFRSESINSSEIVFYENETKVKSSSQSQPPEPQLRASKDNSEDRMSESTFLHSKRIVFLEGKFSSSAVEDSIKFDRIIWQDPDIIQNIKDSSSNDKTIKHHDYIELTPDRMHMLSSENKEVNFIPTKNNYENWTQAVGTHITEQDAIEKLYSSDLIAPPGTCEPIAQWHAESFPTCNSFHETDLIWGLRKFLNHGEYRDVWSLDYSYHMNDSDSKSSSKSFPNDMLAIKTLRIDQKKGDQFIPQRYEQHRIDALVTEKLSFSYRAMKIYGYCGQSTLNSLALQGGTAAITKPINSDGILTPIQRLRYAKDVSKAISDLHSVHPTSGSKIKASEVEQNHMATIIHRDVRSSNFLLSHENRLVVHDFNLARFAYWNPTTKNYCGMIKPACTETRAPEECWATPLTEKIDVYALGSVLFLILTGKQPYEGKDDETIRELTVNGTLPEYPDDIRNTKDPYLKAIKEVIAKCHRFNPEDRPSAKNIADNLDSALRRLENNDEAKSTASKTKKKKKKTEK